MSIDARHSLTVRSGLTILAGSVVLTVALSIFFYQRIFEEQVTQADRQLQQLVGTVESSAAVAAYLDNAELATDVVRGLTKNDIVISAALQSVTGMRIVSGDVSGFDESQLHQFPLKAPFMPDESIGSLSLQPNRPLIEQRAREVAVVYIATLVAHSLVLTILTILLVHWRLARPLTALARDLHEIEPGSASRLPLPTHRRRDEVAQLVDDINALLAATQGTLEGERRLRQYVESVERRFRLIFDHASCGISLVDRNGLVLFSNPSFNRIMTQGRPSADVTDFLQLFEDPAQVNLLLQHAVEEELPVSVDLLLSGELSGNARWLHALFSSVQNEDGDLLVECILYDISERARREREVQQEAERDALTQLYNRRAGERHLRQALVQVATDQQSCALMMIDLDRFKPINDTYGHDAGDRVLIAIAQRLSQSLRKQDVVVRWGGDEFVVLVFTGRDADTVSLVADKLLQTISQPIDLGGGRSGQVGASIGIALVPAHGLQLDDLIAKADSAMYEVKDHGRHHFSIYREPESPAAFNSGAGP